MNNYKELINDCKGILTEGGFIARMSRIEVYHTLGGRIVEDKSYRKNKKGNKKLLKKLASKLQTSHRLLYYAVKFYTKFNSIDMIPEGKDISWTQIVNKYLTNSKKKRETPDTKCPFCGKWFIKT